MLKLSHLKEAETKPKVVEAETNPKVVDKEARHQEVMETTIMQTQVLVLLIVNFQVLL
jgi:hypothetical protein